MNVKVSGLPIEEREIQRYIADGMVKYGDSLKSMDINVASESEVELTYHLESPEKFERIRRITGYLVGSLDRWNKAKQAEERDRVKHTTQEV